MALRIAPLVLLLLLAACRPPPDGDGPPPPPPAGGGLPVFVDVTDEAGITFVHQNGASARRYLPETMGSGVAFFDFDGDERPDLYFVNSVPVEPSGEPLASGALYRNRGDGTFEDVTAAAGLDEPFFGMGAAVGDVDNDGDLDLFVSGVGGDRFFRNGGDGTFADATAEAGLGGSGFGSSAAFLDYDRDGRLDLFVGRYVTWSREADVACSPDGEHRSYCTPEIYPGQSNRLYRNLGGGRFEDVTRAAGLERPEGKTLGVVPLDQDGDGWPDLAVANDTVRNFLFVNRGPGEDGRVAFREEGVELGMAFSVSGATRGAMGVDAGDLDGDGREDLVIGNFSQEMSAVYRASTHGLFVDEAARLGIGLPTLMPLAFGTLVADLDGDGWLDATFANGHIEPEIERFQSLQTYAQAALVFRNRGGGGFEPVTAEAGPLAGSWVGRGLAAADYDGDGDLDLVLTQNGRRARLWRNDGPRRAFIRLRPEGTASNRTGYGAVVTAVAGERRIRRRLVSGRSYLSASEPVVTIGLGDLERLDAVEILWPSGIRQTLPDPELGRLHVVREAASEAAAGQDG